MGKHGFTPEEKLALVEEEIQRRERRYLDSQLHKLLVAPSCGFVIKFQRIEKLDEPLRSAGHDFIVIDGPPTCLYCGDHYEPTPDRSGYCTWSCEQDALADGEWDERGEPEPRWVAADRVATASWHRRPCPMCEIVDLASAHMTAQHPVTKQEVCLACKFKPPLGWAACPATHKAGKSSCTICRATPGMLEVA